ncbi:A/G-specific adenine glycosylase [Gracilibacillus sp. S3-1-1]|uniref:A/G-specific adenine glycosylase n=1 Tax=Gracilibacillus pellucidus TaxID=3095368 RepID=A0ACC6M9W5_9BACI|nr:A/G-specific adenine glycosylase [Gracilibacillus sp. S3-1-1]MDX8047657.1 A/G-specific adenine glycosylase [Gracilibacillus sp. S3-1-1]
MKYASTINISNFQKDLITWFEEEQRMLPWRENQDPYRVWVSEIMLQQTKVDTVIPYFNNFMEKFPTVTALAEAPEQDVLKAWEGLGYYSRARNLQTAVREVVEQYDAKVPDDPKQFGDLKGVGPYTQGAVLSIAFDKAEPAVDGNVMRVLSRVLLIEEDIAKPKTRKTFEAAVRELISQENPSAFNQGLMELGALVCTPTKPSCLLCPVQEHCIAYREGVEQTLPIKKKKVKQSFRSYFALVLEDEAGNILLEQRPSEGLLAQLWQFPMVDTKEVDEQHLAAYIQEKFQIEIVSTKDLEPVKHVFSHLTWHLDVKFIRIKGEPTISNNMVKLTRQAIEQYPLPVSHQNIYKQI